MWKILDDNNLRKLLPEKRLEKLEEILKHDIDPSKRWDAVWLVGELAKEGGSSSLYDKAADLLVWALENDDSGVVKHEVCYQIVSCNMREKIPDLLNCALNDKSSLARHEALECLGGMEAFEIKDDLKKALNDPVYYVAETAAFAIRRLDRMENRKGQFQLSEIA